MNQKFHHDLQRILILAAMAANAPQVSESADFQASPENLMIQGLFFLGDACSVISNNAEMQDIANAFYGSALGIYSVTSK